MQNRDRSDNSKILDRDVHMAAKVAALDDPSQFCSQQLTRPKRSDLARSYHHEVTQRVQLRIDQTRFAQGELWIKFGMPMWVGQGNVRYDSLEVSTADEASRHAHAEVADEDLEDPEEDDDDPLLTGFDRRYPRKSTQVQAFQAGDADDEGAGGQPGGEAEKSHDKGSSRAEADNPDAAPGGEDHAELSGSRNSSGLHIEE